MGKCLNPGFVFDPASSYLSKFAEMIGECPQFVILGSLNIGRFIVANSCVPSHASYLRRAQLIGVGALGLGLIGRLHDNASQSKAR